MPRDAARRLAEVLEVDVLVAPALETPNGPSPSLVMTVVDSRSGRVVTCRGAIGASGDIETPARSCLDAILTSPVNKAAPEGAATAPRDPSEAEPADEGPSDEPRKWGRWDHAGFFIDGAFAATWCLGEELCEGADTGFSGRLRGGYRILSVLAVSVSGAVGGHEVPITDETEEILEAEQAIIWAALSLGLRYHPVKRFPLDPFIGLDLGWSWLIHSVSREVTGIPEELIPEGAIPYLRERTILTLNGFTLSPQVGFRFFITPALAIGVTTEWIIPFYRSACVRTQSPSASGIEDNPKECAEIDDIGNLDQLSESRREELGDRSSHPRFLNLEIGLTAVF